ncbi:MAG: GldG family protein [Deltaproteobacteria bacterium]|nr:GldG family protein [Deltaproteobacteria bacterium]
MSRKTVIRICLLVAASGIGIGALVWLFQPLYPGSAEALGPATRSLLQGLSQSVSVRAYASTGLPGELGQTVEGLAEMLDAFGSCAGGKLEHEVVDPESLAEADKQRLAKLGVRPVRLQIRKEDEIEAREITVALVAECGDRTASLPFIRDLDHIEYDLATLISRVCRARPRAAIVAAADEASAMKRILAHFSRAYDLRIVDPASLAEIEAFDAILVMPGSQAYADTQLATIDRFVQSGRPVAILASSVRLDAAAQKALPAETGLERLLARYGIELVPGLVADAQCRVVQAPVKQGGFAIVRPIPYPLIPQIGAPCSDHPLTRGVYKISFPFASPLRIRDPLPAGAIGTSLVLSSDRSLVLPPPVEIRPDQKWSFDAGPREAQILAAALGGKLPRFSESDRAQGWAQVIVLGAPSLLDDRLLSQENLVLLDRLFDLLTTEPALLATFQQDFYQTSGLLSGFAEPSPGTLVYTAGRTGIPALIQIAVLVLVITCLYTFGAFVIHGLDYLRSRAGLADRPSALAHRRRELAVLGGGFVLAAAGILSGLLVNTKIFPPSQMKLDEAGWHLKTPLSSGLDTACRFDERRLHVFFDRDETRWWSPTGETTEVRKSVRISCQDAARPERKELLLELGYSDPRSCRYTLHRIEAAVGAKDRIEISGACE